MRRSGKSVPAASSFNALPTEMKLKILQLLPAVDKREARLVSKEWSSFLSSSFDFTFQITDSNVKFILNTKQNIDRIYTGVLQQTLPISSSRGGILDTTEQLVINSKVSSDNIRKLLHNCPNIWFLELNCLSKNALQASLLMRNAFPMQFLEDLKLTFLKFETYQGTVLRKLSESVPQFPSLGSFELRWEFSRLPPTKLAEFYDTYLSIHQFISRHKTLSSVDIDFSTVSCCGWWHRSVTLDAAVEKRYNDLIAIPPKSDFFMLCIGFPSHEGEYPWTLSTTLMKAQTELAKVGLDMETVIASYPFAPLLNSVFSKSIQSLISVTIILPDSLEINCSCLKECRKLVFLYVESFRPLRQVQELPKNVYKVTLEGRPSLSSTDRRWMADNMRNIACLKLNLLFHPLRWSDNDSEVEVLADFERFLSISTIRSLSVTAYSFYDYSGVILLSTELGFTHNIYRNTDLQQITFEFIRELKD